ncbi:restriction endonuclease subunit S [Streptococcus infantis]|uniref:restriction endonuclease subunit S n=1 Tax=Streptococcus infantis TaxID=68892 RepID=UPI0039C43073
MKKVKLGEVTINIDNRRKPLNNLQRIEKSLTKKYPYCGANNIIDFIDEYIFDENEEILCIAEDGGSWGKDEECTYVMNEKCWVNNHAHVLKMKSGVDINYIKLNLDYIDLSSYITGSTRGKLTKSSLEKIEIKLPDYHTQISISKKISDIQNLITKKKVQIQKYNELVKSRFNEMFGGNKQFESIDNLFDIIDGDRGKNYPKSDELFDEEYCLFLNTKNVTKNGFSFITNQFITETKDKLLRKGKLERYDIVLTTRGTVGNVAYYDESIKYKHLRINSGMVILRPKKPNLNQKFIIHVLRNNNYSRVISGSAQPQLPITKLKKILLPLPPLSLQNEFADFVAQVDKSQLAIQKSLEELETLKKSLMQEYFG